MTAGAASFTAAVVAELAPHTPPLPCCRAALVEGMALAGEPPDPDAAAATTRPAAARAALAALHADRIPARVERRRHARRTRYAILVDPAAPRPAASGRLCCARSRVRGAFLSCGTVARPDAAPHLEVLCRDAAAAAVLGADLDALGVAAGVAVRRGRPVVTARTADAVASALSVIGAQGGRLRFEEGRVVREVRAHVNRRTNSETANLRRTVGAGLRQVEAAGLLRADTARWDRLPPALREAAELRTRHPDEPLERLAALAGCSRSAMAGRMRRLVEEAAGTAV